MRSNTDTGIFQFHEDGFEIALPEAKKYIKWKDIEQIHAYKTDSLTYDEICLEIVLQTTAINISEETEGWNYFIKMINQQFPSINKNWDWDVSKPAFATNFTILYKKKAID